PALELPHDCALGVADDVQEGVAASTADLPGRSSVDLGEHGVEAPEACEAGAEGDLRHGEVRAVEQTLGALHPRRLCHLQWARAEMLAEEAGEMAGTHSEAGRQCLDIGTVEGALLDEPHGTLDGGERAFPGRRERRSLRSAA